MHRYSCCTSPKKLTAPRHFGPSKGAAGNVTPIRHTSLEVEWKRSVKTKMNQIPSYFKYWGKFDPAYCGASKWTPMVYHCLDERIEQILKEKI